MGAFQTAKDSLESLIQIMKGLLIFLLLLIGLGVGLYFGSPKFKLIIDDFVADKREELDGARQRPEDTADKGPAEQLPPREPAEDKAPAQPKETAQSEVDRLVEDLYPMPDIKPLLELVDNWTMVPERIFPREIVVKVPVEMVLKGAAGQGGSKTSAGSKVTAVSAAGTSLTVVPFEGASVQGVVVLEDTDLREQLEKQYDEFVERRTNEVIALREAEKERIGARKEKAVASGETWSMPTIGYTDGSDPKFDPVKASLRRGEAGDRVYDDAKRWRWAGPEWVKGTQYDAALVQFEVSTIFGTFKNEVKALMQNGEVVKWVWPDTNKEVDY